MKYYNNTLTEEMKNRLKNLIGKKFLKIRCEKNEYTNKPSIPVFVGMYFENDEFELSNDYEKCDFFLEDGETECTKFMILNIDNKSKKFNGLFDFSINEKIKDVKITTDTISTENEVFISDVAITFFLETKNLTFYRQVYFSPFIDLTISDEEYFKSIPQIDFDERTERVIL